MEPEAALRTLSAEYAAAVDTLDMARLVDQFEPDGSLIVPGPRPWVLRGHVELAELAKGLEGFTRTFHLVGQGTYRIYGTAATGEVYCKAHHLSASGDTAAAGSATDSVWFIRYHDSYRSHDDVWRISERRIELLWTEDRSAVLPPES